MSQPAPEEKQEKKEEKKKSGGTFKIGEFLQSPKKKRRQFIQLAVSEGMDRDLVAAIQNFLRKQFPSLGVSAPANMSELKRQSGRNIVLLVIDDEFAPLPEVLGGVQALKSRKADQATPVLFLTRKPEELVAAYHEVLLPYQESDDFINYTGVTTDQILSRIKLGLELKGRRRSRRYKVNMPISCFHLTQNVSVPVAIVDMSVHGALLRASEGVRFRLGDQLRLSIPVSNYLTGHGDFLKVSAKVRRVFISGDLVGVSFEYVSDHLSLQLSQFVVSLVNSQLSRSGTPTTTKRV